MWNKIKHLLFRNVSPRQTIAKNTFWLGIANVGGRLTRAVIIIYSARVLGAADWGIFSYMVSLVAFIEVFTDVGISPIFVRETAKLHHEPERKKQILSTSFYLKLVLLLLGVLAAVFIAPHFIASYNAVTRTVLYLVIFILAFDTVRDFGFSIIRAQEKMQWEAGLYLFMNVAIVVFGFLSLYLSRSVVAFTFAYALGTGVGMIATVYALRHELAGIFSNFSTKLTNYIVKSAWPFAVSSVMAVLMINTDILIIGWLNSVSDVGLYSAAQRIVQLLYLLPSVMNISLLPTFARLAKTDDQKLRATLETVLSALFMIAIPIAIGGFILGREITLLVFGSGYLGSTTSFRILILTILIDFPATILTSFIFAYNEQKKLTIYAAIGGISNVLFDLILIPRFGIAGSAVSTFTAQLLSQAYLRTTAKRINHYRVLPRLTRVFSAAALMTLVVLALKLFAVPVVLIIAAGGLIYLGALVLLREPLVREAKLILRPAASALPEESGSLS